MTEQEFLASADPAAMLSWLLQDASPVAVNHGLPHARPTDRKLRLWGCAVSRRLVATPASHSHLAAIEEAADAWPSDWYELPFEIRSYWCCDSDLGRGLENLLGTNVPGTTTKADILRDIVGNPFRPLEIYEAVLRCSSCGRDNPRTRAEHFICVECTGVVETATLTPAWITPTVLALAGAAYKERLDDGTLDPDRLAVLSDALEESGCPAWQECPDCGGSGWDPNRAVNILAFCRRCQADPGKWDKGTGRVPHPLLAHLRSPGPHYRGMWSLDLVLGKE